MNRIVFGFGVALAVSVVHTPSLDAGTIAYYRFENGSDFQAASSPILDQTGAHNLDVESGSDARYRAVVPGSFVPQTGAPNSLSMEFTSLASLRSNDSSFNNFGFSKWTVEAYVNFKTLAGFQTFVGKDGTGPDPIADFYLQMNGRNNAFSIIFKGADGTIQGFDGVVQPAANTWYHVAAVYDGSSISLYVDGTLDKSAPVSSPLIVEDTPWTIGRGYFGGPTDAPMAFVDEVRFSDDALSPSQFLNAPAVPEPASLTLFGLGLAALFVYYSRLHYTH
jgi:hypothetical protein